LLIHCQHGLDHSGVRAASWSSREAFLDNRDTATGEFDEMFVMWNRQPRRPRSGQHLGCSTCILNLERRMTDHPVTTIGPTHKRRATGLAMLGNTDHRQVRSSAPVDFGHQLDTRVC
jgi:hypothetical protein